MKSCEQIRFDKLYQRHLRALKLQGMSDSTIDVYARSVRRVRDYGFLHGNTKKMLSLMQLVLLVVIESRAPRPRPTFKCPRCQSPMQIIGFVGPAWLSG